MIIRYDSRCQNINKATPEALRKIIDAADLDVELQAARVAVVKESANGPSLALRRLREKVKRLEKRLASGN